MFLNCWGEGCTILITFSSNKTLSDKSKIIYTINESNLNYLVSLDMPVIFS